MAKETEMRMNVVAINRVDPYVKQILDSSTHVALYTFNVNEWEKTDIEGALFVYARNAEPYHSIFINNRLNTTSLVEPITRFELQCQPPFLLYRNERSKIRGFWFYNSSECSRIGQLISQLVKSTQPHDTKSTVKTPSNSNVNILSMLSKAQEDFNKEANVPSFMAKDKSGHLNRTFNNPSVMNFFGAIPSDAKTLQKLKSTTSQPVHTLDEIEKKHQTGAVATQMVTNEVKNLRLSSPEPAITELGSLPLVSFFNSVNLGNQARGLQQNLVSIPNAIAVSEIEQEQAKPLDQGDINKKTKRPSSSSAVKLIPPTMFEASVKNSNDNCFEERTANSISALTKDQMVQAMTYLLKNDSNFVNLLHETYVNCVAKGNF